jgi:hypothetical protein
LNHLVEALSIPKALSKTARKLIEPKAVVFVSAFISIIVPRGIRMPLIAPIMKTKFKKTIYNGLKKNFSDAASKGDGFPKVADEFWEKLADAISEIAADIVEEITTNAQVAPGISVVGAGGGVPGPMAGATVSPGKII